MTAWYEDEVRVLAARPAPAPGSAIAFLGGSSIRLWEAPERDFPGRTIVNLGFGGATLGECVEVFDRLVPRIAPRALLLYAGDNDVAQGVKSDEVALAFERFAGLMSARLPGVPWAVPSIKPSPSRRAFAFEVRRANRLIKAAVAEIPDATFIDIHSAMLDERSTPPFKYFTDDWLHMNRAGYELWARRIASWMDRVVTAAIIP